MRWVSSLIAVLVVICATLPVAGRAQSLVETLEEEFFESIRDKPERYLETASKVILGYGRGGRIDAQGIETMIAVRRASGRAGVMRRLLVADLDNDGTVTPAEIGKVMPTLAASLRSRLVMIHRQADADQSGEVSAQELRAYAEGQARRVVSEQAAEDLRRLMLLDDNGDGWVTIQEASDAIDLFRDGA